MSRAVLLAALLLCGCVGRKPVDPPSPEPDVPNPPIVLDGTAAGVGAQFEKNFRDSCLIAAGKLRKDANGKRVWSTDREYLEGHRELQKIALEHSGRGFVARQQLEATPFDPDRMADWLEMVAKEGLPE